MGKNVDHRRRAAPLHSDFFLYLFSTDELAWYNAIEKEAEHLAGCILDEDSFRTLIRNINLSAPGFVTPRWIKRLAPYLSDDQIDEICRVSGVERNAVRRTD